MAIRRTWPRLKSPAKLLPKVLVLYKKSAYEDHFEGYRRPPFRKAFEKGDLTLRYFKKSHERHYETLSRVLNALKKRKIAFDAYPRGAKKFNGSRRYAFVIAVGGDGTVLEASHETEGVPILGVNSDPRHSIGKFSVASHSDFEKILDRHLAGRSKILKIQRLSLFLDGKPLGFLALNDVLVSHRNPAAMSHYLLEIGPQKEQQKSSGLWISTAAGSTGGLKSAGGRPLSLASRLVQYRPRELYRHRFHYRLTGGALSSHEKIRVRSLMKEGMIYVDGAHYHYAFGFGSVLRVGASTRDLALVVRGGRDV